MRQRLGVLRDLQAKKQRTPIGAYLVNAYQEGTLTARALREGARASSSSCGDLGGLLSRSMDKVRTRKGNTKPDTRSDSRFVNKVLRKGSLLPAPYTTQIPLWDVEANCQVMGDISVYPPHESLDALVQGGTEDEWASFDDSQQGIRAYLRKQAPSGQNNVLYRHLNHGFGGKGGMCGPVTLKIDREMKFYRRACRPPLAWATPRGATHASAKFQVRTNPDQ